MVTNTFQFAWEVNLMVWIQAHILNNPFMIKVCTLFTYFGEPILGVVLIGVFYFGTNKKLGKHLGLNMLATCVINPLIKNIFFRIRPYFVNDNIKCLKPVDSSADIYDVFAQGYSFPSGHTMSATSLYTTLAMYIKKKKTSIIACVLVLLVAFSRFALGVHYPTDVMVGALAGLLVVLVYAKFSEKITAKKIMIGSVIVFGIGLFYCKTNDYYQLYGLFIGFVCGCLFEEKYVNFNGTNNILKIIIRIIFGVLVFLAFNKGLKIPFNKEFLESGSILSNFITMLRYGLGIFMTMGVYPLVFKYNYLKLDDKMKDGE